MTPRRRKRRPPRWLPAPVPRCLACRRVLSAVTEDPIWPGLCSPCVQSGAGLRVVRHPTPPLEGGAQ